jgi:uncharacterized membrane protein YphA (DoxX/SURF4 family)
MRDMTAKNSTTAYITVFTRIALGASFLSAVADRLGLWGEYGQRHVAWGNFARFTAYTGNLLHFLPGSFSPLMAWTATGAEIILGIALIVGLFTRATAVASGILLLGFALAMTFSLGVKSPLDFSVFSASGGAFLLGSFERYRFSLDEVLQRRRERNGG